MPQPWRTPSPDDSRTWQQNHWATPCKTDQEFSPQTVAEQTCVAFVQDASTQPNNGSITMSADTLQIDLEAASASSATPDATLIEYKADRHTDHQFATVEPTFDIALH
jgi:hypothetical protein